jgi:uncharacterized protein
MHFTLHLTTGCNLRCRYCYAPRSVREDMSEEVVDRAVDLAAELDPANAGIVFFGGEPLLRRDLVERALCRCDRLQREGHGRFHFKLTTNGTLLDEPFIEQATRSGLHLALSLDGPQAVHDRHRRTAAGEGSFARVQAVVPALLRHQPHAAALLVVTPETAASYASAVDWLFAQGFRYVIASLHYAGAWSEETVTQLGRQYRRIARLYERRTLRGEKIYFSPFEKKLATHIQGPEAACQRCHFGVRQLSVAPNGDLYPCVQFVQDGRSNGGFAMGDVFRGIDRERQARLHAQSLRRSDACRNCALESRCEHRCSCLNWQATGAVDAVPASLCATEQVLVPIVDRLGERLWARRAPLFVQKHYNAAYPFISGLEDLVS